MTKSPKGFHVESTYRVPLNSVSEDVCMKKLAAHCNPIRGEKAFLRCLEVATVEVERSTLFRYL